MPYPNYLVGEPLHKGSDLVIMDAKDSAKPAGQPADPINQGATGVVWRVIQAGVMERAVKVLSPEAELLQEDGWEYFAEVFEGEMHRLARLSHSNLAKLISFGRIPSEEAGSGGHEGVGIPYIWSM
ncbi:MAG: hypothetical protein NTZ17_20920 [Phycisphaerae bacterium]|nr:hypothetical protein [Phycisphaerae bacterium]